jgi:hypothetical protein
MISHAQVQQPPPDTATFLHRIQGQLQADELHQYFPTGLLLENALGWSQQLQNQEAEHEYSSTYPVHLGRLKP